MAFCGTTIFSWLLLHFFIIGGALPAKIDEHLHAELKESVEITSGVFWQQLQGLVIYEGSVPLAYSATWPVSDVSSLNASHAADTACKAASNNVNCAVVRLISNMEEIILAHLKTLDQSLIMDITNVTNSSQAMSRNARSIEWIGQAFEWCCGLVTKKSTDNLVTTEEGLRKYADNLDNIIHQDHESIRNLSIALQRYDRGLNKILLSSAQASHNLSDAFRYFRNETITNLHWQQIFTHATLLLTASLSKLQLKTIRSIYGQQIIEACRAHRIPAIVVSKDLLLGDLNKLQNLLKDDKRELAINIKDVTSLYHMDIAECRISQSTVIVTIKIPVKSTGRKWKLFEAVPVPFSWHVRSVQVGTVFFAVSGDQMTEISGVALHVCQPHTNALCLLPRLTFSPSLSNIQSCRRMLFKTASVSNLSHVCPFLCEPSSDVQVTQLTLEMYAITHATGILSFECSLHDSSNITIPVDHNVGALEIIVPCDCSLFLNDELLVRELYPCDARSQGKAMITHILPLSWSQSHIDLTAQISASGRPAFDNVSMFLDPQWPLKIPYLNVSIPEKLGNLRPWFNDSVTSDRFDYYILHSSFTSCINWIVTLVVFFIVVRNPYLLGLCAPRPAQAKVFGDIEVEFFEIISAIMLSTVCLGLAWCCYRTKCLCSRGWRMRTARLPRMNKEQTAVTFTTNTTRNVAVQVGSGESSSDLPLPQTSMLPSSSTSASTWTLHV